MATGKLHILLVDNDLFNRGGISTISSALANGMAERGHQVTLYATKTWRQKSRYPLNPAVNLRLYRFTDNNLKVQKLREELRTLNPDVCCPLFPDGRHLVWAVTLLGSGIPLLYSEHHSPRTIEQEWWSRKGRLAAMSGADRIHLLLPAFTESVPDFLRPIVQIIPNPAPAVNGQADAAGRADGRKRLLWLARLQEGTKQCRLAMDAFALLAEKHADWDMQVVGDGPDRKVIRRHAVALNLGDRLKLRGNTDAPLAHYLEAQLFCISSRTEGLPNTLLEAQACGLPAVGFAVCEGVSDLIRPGWNGLLAEEMNAACLAQRLDALMGDAEARRVMGQNALAVRETHSLEKFLDAWEALFAETAACKGNTVMDAFREEPFASMARLSAAARREWLWRDFGKLTPHSPEAALYWLFWQLPSAVLKNLVNFFPRPG
ncbi:MAG: glycosyltransferase [Deltaproteobacteria bacterium]|jgi:glycosyltransferase involved in cell wall biosynthesis|nr:glycosyltransferase [Deltaproteobacteria bacterium]